MVIENKVKKAMILAAGEGTRLRPLTLEVPKALLPINGTPLIEHTLLWLKHHGISEVAINLHHLGHKLKEFLGNGARFGMKVVYSEEEILLGTAGGVKRMEDFFEGTFVVFYGDNLTDFNLSAMIELHRQKKGVATLALFEPSNPSEVGIVEMDEKGRVSRLIEKPESPVLNSRHPARANGGVYILEKEVLDHIPSAGFSDFAFDIFPKLIGFGLPVYGYSLETKAHFIDIGTMEKYQRANRDFKGCGCGSEQSM